MRINLNNIIKLKLNHILASTKCKHSCNTKLLNCRLKHSKIRNGDCNKLGVEQSGNRVRYEQTL